MESQGLPGVPSKLEKRGGFARPAKKAVNFCVAQHAAMGVYELSGGHGLLLRFKRRNRDRRSK